MASNYDDGPAMLVLTAVLTPEPARWGKFIVTLPRPVSVKKLLAGSIGVIIGGTLGTLTRGFSGFLYGALILGFLGVLIVSYSPLRGETFTKWLGLAWKNRRQQQFTIDGKTAAYSIGICPIPLPDNNPLLLVPGSIHVAPGTVDERGTLRHENNFNLLDENESHAFPEEFPLTARTARYDWSSSDQQTNNSPQSSTHWGNPQDRDADDPWVSVEDLYPNSQETDF
jgi:hypothetical protein